MIKSYTLLLHLFLVLPSMQSQAHSVKLGTYNSSSTSQGSIDGTISFPEMPSNNSTIYDFDIGASRSESKTTNSITTDSSLGAGLTSPTDWTLRASISSSKNQTENLSTAEPSLAISKKVYYQDKSPKQKNFSNNTDEISTNTESSADEFEPFITLGFKSSRSYMNQTSVTIRTTRVFTLAQSSNRLNVFWQPLKSWNFSASITRYNYDRDVRSLYALLGNYPYLTQLSANLLTLSDTVATLPESTTSLAIGYSLNSDWDFSFETQRTRDFVSDQYGTTHTVAINYYFLHAWSLHLAIGNSTRSDDNEKSNFSEISLGYIF